MDAMYILPMYSILQCIMGAAMTDKSPFVLPLGKKQQVEAAKQALAVHNSDHVTLLKAFLG